MSMRAWCPGLAACLLLTGCALIQPRVQKPAGKIDCDGKGDCKVLVKVDCSRYFSCDLYVQYDLILVATPHNQSLDIRWELEGEENAEFADNGIVVGNSAFDCKPAGKKKFMCTDKHPEFGVFKYAINVTIKESPFGPRGVQSLDPWIVNR